MLCNHCPVHTADVMPDWKCGFKNGEFSEDNYQCQILTGLSLISDRLKNTQFNSAIDSRLYVVPIPEMSGYSGFVVFTRYKQRGRAGAAVVLDPDYKAQSLTLGLANAVLLEYKELLLKEEEPSEIDILKSMFLLDVAKKASKE